MNGSVNLCRNPRCNSGLTGWASDHGSPSSVADTGRNWARWSGTTSGTEGVFSPLIPVVPGQIVAVRMSGRLVAGSDVSLTLGIATYNASGGFIATIALDRTFGLALNTEAVMYGFTTIPSGVAQ